MQIIKARSNSHFFAIQELQRACLPHDIPSDTSLGHWWVAYEEATPIAFSGMYESRQWFKTSYLCRAGVLPAYRGRGIQKRLIRVRCNYARRIGHEWVITDTTDNPASGNSLIACGFKLYQPANPWAFHRSCYWRKYLCQ